MTAPPATEGPGVTIDLGAPRVFSPTGLDRFNRCERQFYLYPGRDRTNGDRDKGPALQLGTEVHALVQERYAGRPWRDLLPERARLKVPSWDPEFTLPAAVDHAAWLVERHERVYPKLPRLYSTEEYFELQVPNGPVVQGYIDGLVRHSGKLWVLEIKTMSRWARLDWLQWDRQLGTYLWAARELGFDVAGVLYDAILTTRWKTPEDSPKGHPAADSFQRLEIPAARLGGLEAATLQDYRNAMYRLEDIQEHPESARRAAGEQCTWCRVRGACDPAGVWGT